MVRSPGFWSPLPPPAPSPPHATRDMARIAPPTTMHSRLFTRTPSSHRWILLLSSHGEIVSVNIQPVNTLIDIHLSRSRNGLDCPREQNPLCRPRYPVSCGR